MLLPTLTNITGIVLAVATVLVIAYDHKKWTQSNFAYQLMYVPWFALAAIQCLTIISLGGQNVAAGALWLGMALAVLAGGFAYRHLRSTQRTPSSSTAVPSRARLVTVSRPSHP